MLLLAAVTLAGSTAFAAKPAKQPVKAAAPAVAKAAAPVLTSVPPPSGQWEGKPPPADGYVWSQGYYEWKSDRYAWKPGEWVPAKPGMEYRQRQWVQRSDGKWQLSGGDWVAAGQQVAGHH
jgi:hypothetical protein